MEIQIGEKRTEASTLGLLSFRECGKLRGMHICVTQLNATEQPDRRYRRQCYDAVTGGSRSYSHIHLESRQPRHSCR